MHTVTYTYTDGNGCSASATDQMEVVLCTGIRDIAGIENLVKVYPNPFENSAIVELSLVNDKAVECILFDGMGRNVKTIPVDGPSFIINRDGLSAGLYMLSIRTEGGMIGGKRIVIQ